MGSANPWCYPPAPPQSLQSSPLLLCPSNIDNGMLLIALVDDQTLQVEAYLDGCCLFRSPVSHSSVELRDGYFDGGNHTAGNHLPPS